MRFNRTDPFVVVRHKDRLTSLLHFEDAQRLHKRRKTNFLAIYIWNSEEQPEENWEKMVSGALYFGNPKARCLLAYKIKNELESRAELDTSKYLFYRSCRAEYYPQSSFFPSPYGNAKSCLI